MAELEKYTFEHTEIAKVLVKHANVHEGYWGVYIEFGLAGANVSTSPDGRQITPAAITFVNKIGIQRFEAPTNLTIDAAAVNPATTGIRSRKKSRPS